MFFADQFKARSCPAVLVSAFDGRCAEPLRPDFREGRHVVKVAAGDLRHRAYPLLPRADRLGAHAEESGGKTDEEGKNRTAQTAVLGDVGLEPRRRMELGGLSKVLGFPGGNKRASRVSCRKFRIGESARRSLSIRR